MKEVRLIIRSSVRLQPYGPPDGDEPAITDDFYFSKNERIRFTYPLEGGNPKIQFIKGSANYKVRRDITHEEASNLLKKRNIIAPIKKIFLGWLRIDKFGEYAYVEHIINLKSGKQIISGEFEVEDSDYEPFLKYLKQRFGHASITIKSVFELLK